jgi:hypothetical protein
LFQERRAGFPPGSSSSEGNAGLSIAFMQSPRQDIMSPGRKTQLSAGNLASWFVAFGALVARAGQDAPPTALQ